MALTVSHDVIQATRCERLERYRNSTSYARHASGEYEIDLRRLQSDDLEDLCRAAGEVGDGKLLRAIESIQLAASGKFDKAVPSFKAFKGVLESFLKHEVINGWIFVRADDGKLYPELVNEIVYDSGRNSETPSVIIRTTSYGCANSNRSKPLGIKTNSHHFAPQQVAKRRIADILAAEGIFKETSGLIAEHEVSVGRYRQAVQGAFADQFRVSGGVFRWEGNHYSRRDEKLSRRRVIHDLESQDCGPIQHHADSFLFEGGVDDAGVGPVPEHPVVRVFDLQTHEMLWVHADYMTPYEYDKSLRDKLVLPASHRDLLNVLTTDLDAFVNDFIEGKSAGNVILCKGIPGVGKTLTAEVYAELIERPLYSIHSGSLGTSASEIGKNLKSIFQRAKRWGCVLLLDEADVFVTQRGTSIEQNAVVAEFLRTLEYMSQLFFMTTNRVGNIDEAIISRCAAIIEYSPPSKSDAAAIWKVMAAQFETDLSETFIEQLLDLFPEIAPRDIKMLFRLALRVSKAHQEPLTLNTFRRCAMFRAVKINQATVNGDA